MNKPYFERVIAELLSRLGVYAFLSTCLYFETHLSLSTIGQKYDDSIQWIHVYSCDENADAHIMSILPILPPLKKLTSYAFLVKGTTELDLHILKGHCNYVSIVYQSIIEQVNQV